MSRNSIVNKLMIGASKIGFQLRKNSPEILIGVGIVGTVTSAVLACKATLKVNDLLEDAKKEIETIKKIADDPTTSYTEDDKNKALAIKYTKIGLDFVKLYAPAITVGALSISCLIASHNVLTKRNALLASAYATLDQTWKSYRERVEERFGSDIEKEIRYNLQKDDAELATDGEIKEVKSVSSKNKINSCACSEFAKFFDSSSNNWSKDPNYNLMFLRQAEEYANDLLAIKGFVSVNDVYHLLGIPGTPEGQEFGWVYDRNKTKQIDFGIYDMTKEKNRDFVNGYENVILLDFNVEGYLLNRI